MIRSIPKFSEIMPGYRVMVRSQAKVGKGAPALVTADLLERHYRSLERALEGAEAEYRSRTGIKRIESNLVKILADAKQNGLDVLPAMAYDTTNGNETPTNEENVMKITVCLQRRMLTLALLPHAVEPLCSADALGIRLDTVKRVLGEPVPSLQLQRRGKALYVRCSPPLGPEFMAHLRLAVQKLVDSELNGNFRRAGLPE